MPVDQQGPVRTFVLVPEPDLGHAIARRLREDPRIHVIGVSTDPDRDAYRIYDADPDVIVADFEAASTYAADRSMPRTSTPRLCRNRQHGPWPQPTSNTLSPGFI